MSCLFASARTRSFSVSTFWLRCCCCAICFSASFFASSGFFSFAVSARFSVSFFTSVCSFASAAASWLTVGESFASRMRASAIALRKSSSASFACPASCSASFRAVTGRCSKFTRPPISRSIERQPSSCCAFSKICCASANTFVSSTSAFAGFARESSPGISRIRDSSQRQSRGASVRDARSRSSQRSLDASCVKPSIVSCKLCPLSSTRKIASISSSFARISAASVPGAIACSASIAATVCRTSDTN